MRSLKKKTKNSKPNYRLMQVKSIAECSKDEIVVVTNRVKLGKIGRLAKFGQRL